LANTNSESKRLRVAVLGGETLLGREVQEALGRLKDHATIINYAVNGEGNLTDQEGEAVYLEPLTAKTLSENQAVLIAGSAESAAKVYEFARASKNPPSVIDCTGSLEGQPEARIIAPLVEEVGAATSWLQIVAHPAASAIALVLSKLARYAGMREAVAHIFEPASERGKQGITELHQQTTGLLAFKTLEKKVYDAQLGFNLLPQYGEEAPVKLSSVEGRVERDVATILAKQLKDGLIPMPSMRVVQAPVFHGYSISLWVHFDNNVSADEIGQAIASAQIDVRGEKDEAPNSVGATSQSGLIAGDIRTDRNNPRAVWLWLVGDNLRLTADDAVEIVSKLKAFPK
jgi:aspartate-semialdehyde dehydrogenase